MYWNMSLEYHVNVTIFFLQKFVTLASFKSPVGTGVEWEGGGSQGPITFFFLPFQVEYIAGGATQNSMRVAQWILGKPKSTAYFGCVGTEESGKLLEKVAKEAGVDVRYQKSEEHPTGKCAVLITGHHRYRRVEKEEASNGCCFPTNNNALSTNFPGVSRS